MTSSTPTISFLNGPPWLKAFVRPAGLGIRSQIVVPEDLPIQTLQD